MWSTDAMQSAASAAKHAEHGLSKTAPAQLDEFGRDISLETGGLESERQARLSRRNHKMKVCNHVTLSERSECDNYYHRLSGTT